MKGGWSSTSATKQCHFMCSIPPLPLFLSPSPFLPFFLSLIGAHNLVFHHTYPHLNFTNAIYCYLYPLLSSLLLLLLLLWLELLSSHAIFSFFFISMVLKIGLQNWVVVWVARDSKRLLCPKNQRKKGVESKKRNSY